MKVQAAVARSSAAAARSRWMECLFFISGCLFICFRFVLPPPAKAAVAP